MGFRPKTCRDLLRSSGIARHAAFSTKAASPLYVARRGRLTAENGCCWIQLGAHPLHEAIFTTRPVLSDRALIF